MAIEFASRATLARCPRCLLHGPPEARGIERRIAARASASHELADTSRVDRRSHPLGGGFGGSLEAHESAHERVETGVRGVALGADKQRVEAMLWVLDALRHDDAEAPEARRTDGDEQRRRRLAAIPKILESRPNEVAAGQVVPVM